VSPDVSVIIPAYREKENLRKLLALLHNEPGVEVIVSIPKGDSVSLETARNANARARIVEGEQGRGAQLDNGAKQAEGQIFVFCHADTILPEGWKRTVMNIMQNPGTAGGAFRLKFDSYRPVFRCVAFWANLRASLLGLVYGDQAIFTTKEMYRMAGGFRPLPIMEDVDFIAKLRKFGKIRMAGSAVTTSARRYEKNGVWKTVARNTVLITLYRLGLHPVKLADIARRRR